MNIQIIPQILSGSINGIASKSFAHRALICAALAKDESKIKINASSEDIDATVDCLQSLGAIIEKNGDVYSVTPIKSPLQNAEINCRESGSTLRFLLPVICALGTETVISACGRLPERPLSPLKEELLKNGVKISDAFPLEVSGKIGCGEYSIRGNVSSQFITGLLLALCYISGESKINLIPPVESRPYIDITLSVLRQFGAEIKEENNVFYIKGGLLTGQDFTVEADWSNAAFWLCSGVEVQNLNPDSAQGDKAILDVLTEMGATVTQTANGFAADVSALHGCRVDASQIPDAVPVIAAVAATAKGETVIYNAQRLRLKESDRIETTAAMLRSLGAEIKTTADGLIISGKQSLSGGTTESFGDHRIAMAAAVAAQKCTGAVTIANADAVSKSYPAFFEDYNSLGGKAYVL
ncbi:MAG: 3-phosphoshikimate 1-carboxyvinyltransferase [Clostridia bacterium]|nr:3-phosphoshikimate 1-carboxyvinyltransferase [Clostridia bacterium]